MTFDDHPLLDCLPIPVDAIVQDGQAWRALPCTDFLPAGGPRTGAG
jgi:hypothetical protein